jgi:hypothetical protein
MCRTCAGQAAGPQEALMTPLVHASVGTRGQPGGGVPLDPVRRSLLARAQEAARAQPQAAEGGGTPPGRMPHRVRGSVQPGRSGLASCSCSALCSRCTVGDVEIGVRVLPTIVSPCVRIRRGLQPAGAQLAECCMGLLARSTGVLREGTGRIVVGQPLLQHAIGPQRRKCSQGPPGSGMTG